MVMKSKRSISKTATTSTSVATRRRRGRRPWKKPKPKPNWLNRCLQAYIAVVTTGLIIFRITQDRKLMQSMQDAVTDVVTDVKDTATFTFQLDEDSNSDTRKRPNIVPPYAAFSKLRNCQVSFVRPNEMNSALRKPLWIPSYPCSGAAGPTGRHSLVGPAIDLLTGHRKGTGGTRGWHMQSTRLHHCHSDSLEIVACITGHPLDEETHPQTQFHEFDSAVVLPVRNFWMAFHMHHHDETILHYKQRPHKQLAQDEWREYRDTFLSLETFLAWKSVIVEWKKMRQYHVALYLPYEKLLNATTGPKLLAQLANVLGHESDSKYPIAPPEDIPCIWYRVVREEWQRQRAFFRYIPGYTTEQRDIMLEGLQTFMDEQKDDPQLFALLQDYYTDVKDNMPLDKAFEQHDPD